MIKAVNFRICCTNGRKSSGRCRAPCVAGTFLLCLLLLPQTGLSQAADPQPESSIPDEAYLFQDIPSVYGASKYEQTVTEAPAFVTIVTARDIKLFGYRTLADILRSAVGFYTTYDRNYSYLGTRGFGRPGDYNTRVLLLIDGYHRLNDSVYDQAPVGTDFPIDVDLIDRVEIIRGPSSSIYGTNALFTVVNVITRRGRDFKGAELSGEAASFDTWKGRLSYGDRFTGGIEALASGSYYYSRGQDLYFKEFDRTQTNNGVTTGRDSDEFLSFFTKLGYQDLTLSGVFHSRDKQIPTAPWNTVFNDPRTKTSDERAYFDLKYERSLENQLGLMLRTYYDHYDYRGTYPYYAAEENPFLRPVISRDHSLAERCGGEFQLTKTLLDRHKLVFGGEYRFNSQEDQFTYDEKPYHVYLDKDHTSSTGAVYAQDEFRISKKFIINAGVRYDYFESFGGTVNPRLGLIYHPLEQTFLKFLYGEAFRAPNAYELFYEDGTTFKSNPNLDPETIKTYELVWEQFMGSGIRFALAGFYYTVDDLISLQLDPADGKLFFKNLDGASAKGIEAEFEKKWTKGIETSISYAYQDAIDDRTDEGLTNSPMHQAKFHSIVPIFPESLFWGTEFIYQSPRKTLRGRQTDDAFLINMTLFWSQPIKGLDLSCSLYNLLNQKFEEPGSEEHMEDMILQDGILFRIKATYSF